MTVALGTQPQPPTTTAEQDRETAAARSLAAVAEPTATRADDARTAGQRHINLIWERTQQTIAVLAVTLGLGVSSIEVLRGGPNAAIAFNLITAIVSLIAGVYFQRTNHTRSGGPGGDSAGER